MGINCMTEVNNYFSNVNNTKKTITQDIHWYPALPDTKRKGGEREGHWGRGLGYVDSTKVICSFRRKRNSISLDVRMIPFAHWSRNFKRADGLRGNTFCQYVDTPKEPQLLCNKNAGCMKKYKSLSSENLNQRKQGWQQEQQQHLFIPKEIQIKVIHRFKKNIICFHLYNDMRRSQLRIVRHFLFLVLSPDSLLPDIAPSHFPVLSQRQVLSNSCTETA